MASTARTSLRGRLGVLIAGSLLVTADGPDGLTVGGPPPKWELPLDSSVRTN
jgi:hypothetical protein